MNKILLPDESYRILRQDSREALGRLGIGSNPAFTDHNILTRLSDRLGVESPLPYDEYSEYSGEMFRDNLASILGLEPPSNVLTIREKLFRPRRA